MDDIYKDIEEYSPNKKTKSIDRIRSYDCK